MRYITVTLFVLCYTASIEYSAASDTQTAINPDVDISKNKDAQPGFFSKLFKLAGDVWNWLRYGSSFNPQGLGHFQANDFSHVVVIPDIHGDADFFIESLWVAFSKLEQPVDIDFKIFRDKMLATAETVKFPEGEPLVKPERSLSKLGRQVAIVQLGDIMDRGPLPYLSYKILASIESVIGWRLIQLFGNHELMIYNPYCDGIPDSRGIVCGEVILHYDTRYNDFHGRGSDIKNETIAENKIDGIQYLFQPGGILSKYILSRDLVVARIGGPLLKNWNNYRVSESSADTLFVHAGVERELYTDASFKFDNTKESPNTWIERINEFTRREFIDKPEYAAQFVSRKTSPVYTRKIPDNPPKKPDDWICSNIDTALKELQVSRVIVGHTPGMEIRSYCNNKFIVTDVAISRGFEGGGQPYAMIIKLSDTRTEVDSIIGYFENPKGTYPDDIPVFSTKKEVVIYPPPPTPKQKKK